MGYLIFIVAIIIFTWFVAKDTITKRNKVKKMSDNEVRRKYEDKLVENESQRRNNEIGKIYATEFAEQDYLDDKFKNKTDDDIEALNFMLPKDINTVGKLQGTEYNEKDRIDDEYDNQYYRQSLRNPEKRMDSVEQVLHEAYKEQQRGDHALGGSENDE